MSDKLWNYEDFKKQVKDAKLQDAIVSTGSDITAKVEIKEGISKTARMYLAKDILCSIITNEGTNPLVEMSHTISYSYAIADRIIKEGGL